MKIYVVCDLEGVAGVIDHHQQCQWDVAKGWYAPYLAQALRLATLELNALVEGALEGSATGVVRRNLTGATEIRRPENTKMLRW